MGNFTAYNQNNFKSASLLFSKIKREFRSFSDANLIDDADFPMYVAEILNKLGIGTFKEEEALITVKNKKACLPKDFKQLYAAYKCGGCTVSSNNKHLQQRYIIENDITCEVLQRKEDCEIHCDCPDKIIERVTIKQYVNENQIYRDYTDIRPLKLSPNVKPLYAEDCINLMQTCSDEISITSGYIYTNFSDGDIYLKYYAFPLDDEGIPMIPNIMEIEKAIEWWIKYQLMLNFWLVDDLQNAQGKWQKAEQEYEKWMAEARYILKLPSFSQMVNTIRNKKSINAVSIFSQMDRR